MRPPGPRERFAPSASARAVTIGRPDEIRKAAVDLGIHEIRNIYGSTETYGNCCVTHHDTPLDERLVSQGPPLPGVELRSGRRRREHTLAIFTYPLVERKSMTTSVMTSGTPRLGECRQGRCGSGTGSMLRPSGPVVGAVRLNG